MAITGLQWLFDPAAYGTHLWTGPFGSTPTFRGLLDADLQKSGKSIFGSGDADVDLGSTGTLHASTLIFLVNSAFNNAQLGVSAVACPNGTSPSFDISTCSKKIIDTAGADRQWITSDGRRVWISYHHFEEQFHHPRPALGRRWLYLEESGRPDRGPGRYYRQLDLQ